MRRFELVEGSSSKFWEIELSGTSFTVRYGRIGTNGQTQEKSFPSEEKALKEHDKLVAEKTKKGYAEVGGEAGAGGGVPAAVAAPPKKAAPKKAAEPEATAAGASTDPEAAEAAHPETAHAETAQVETVVLPSGPIVATDPATWPADLRAELHPTRAWPGPRITLDRAAIWKKLRERVKNTKSTQGSTVDSGRDYVASETPPTELPDREVQVALYALLVDAKSPWSEQRWVTSGAELFVDHCVATGGARGAVSAVCDASARAKHGQDPASSAAWERLLEHVVHAEEGDWALARAELEKRADADTHFLGPLAQLFPESGAGDRTVRKAVPNKYGYIQLDPRAVAGITDPATLVDLGKKGNGYVLGTGTSWRNRSADATVLTFVARFGEAVIDPFVELLGKHADADTKRSIARGIALVSTPRAFEALVDRASDKDVIAALRDGALRSPEPALAALARGASGRSAAGTAVRSILAQVVRASDVSAAEAALPEALRKVIEEVRAKGGGDREEASASELPRVLATPPWKAKKSAKAEVAPLELAPLPFQESMTWKPGQRESWQRVDFGPWAAQQAQQLERLLRLSKEQVEGLREGDAETIAAVRDMKRASYFTVYGQMLGVLDATLARSIIEAFASARWYYHDDAFRKLAADHELAFLDPLLAWATASPVEGLAVLAPFESPRIAPLAAQAVFRLKKAQAVGRAWIDAHREAAIVGLVPDAVGKPNHERLAAEHVLRVLAREGHEELVMSVAARFGEAAREAVRAVLDFDALDLLPKKLPKLPDYASPTALPRPVLRESGKAVPGSAMEDVLLCLAMSRLDAPYQGVLDLREACTPESLAEVSWELFQAWLTAGAPSKESWCFTQLGLLGDDECARKLAALVRVWPGESAHQRAVTGLDVLAAIGTDVALMHLHGIAQKVKFKGLQEQARARIDQIADARGLSAAELADRLVPDLGLDEQGTMVLDFGTRSFRVGFDEALKPYVRDESGARIAELPKARKDDDAEKAKAATDLWKALKKDAKTIARQQVLRLELAMCERRRWTAEVFRRFLVEHPLVRHLVVRLVWGTYDAEGKLVAMFRVAEDGTFADANDDAWSLPDDASVGIPHALEVPVSEGEKFGQTFGDYEILQPFKQLGREIHALTDGEKAAATIQRWDGRLVPTGSVLGLESRGWRRGAAEDGGVIGCFERMVATPRGDQLVVLEIEPGVIAGMATEWKEQKLHGVGIGSDWRWRKPGSEAATKMGDLHPIVASEILRDIEALFSAT